MISATQLIDRTADPAFVVDETLTIVACNPAAADLLGRGVNDLVGHPCHTVLAGRDAQGALMCRHDCSPLRCAKAGTLHPGYELQTTNAAGEPVWVHVSIFALARTRTAPGYLVHLMRPIGRDKQLQAFVRDMMASAAQQLSHAPVTGLAADHHGLSRREVEVLALLRQGRSTADIALALRISRTTVRTHTQHILDKLGVHSKMAAALYAEQHNIA